MAGSLFAGEVGWIRGAPAELPPSQGRHLVLDHLARSRFVVAALLDYFVEHSGAIVHIEGNGFYQTDKVILETSRF